jgi:hypothetical protein
MDICGAKYSRQICFHSSKIISSAPSSAKSTETLFWLVVVAGKPPPLIPTLTTLTHAPPLHSHTPCYSPHTTLTLTTTHSTLTHPTLHTHPLTHSTLRTHTPHYNSTLHPHSLTPHSTHTSTPHSTHTSTPHSTHTSHLTLHTHSPHTHPLTPHSHCTRDGADMLRDFLGRDPTIEPFFKEIGL